jgi:glycosyltransferase involved in cell wall biosynthesis
MIIGMERKGDLNAALAGRVVMPRSVLERRWMQVSGDTSRLADRVAPWKPRLIHAHFATDALLALPLARRLGVPLVVTLHGYDVMRTRGALLGSLRLSWARYAIWRRRVIEGGALFLAVSDALRRRAVAQGFPEARVRTHYLGTKLAPMPADAPPREPGLVLHVGRLVEKKGTALLLDAMAQVPGGRLAVIGEGPLGEALRVQASKLGLDVEWLGRLPHEEVRGWMRRATLLAVPSITARDGDAEGLPTVIAEAGAVGLPTVGSDHSGIPEAVVDGVTGFVVPEGDSVQLAARIAELLADPARAGAMGLAARARTEDLFDSGKQIERLEGYYDELLA